MVRNWGARFAVSASTAALLAGGAAAQETAPSEVRLGTVVVTATRTERSLVEVPASVSVVGREEIERRQARSLEDVLNGMPGVDLSGGPRITAAEPNIRGMEGERVVIRVDGARQNFSSGHRGRVFLDPAVLQRVEVLRGPASTLYGSGAIGGVIDFTTRSADKFLRPGERAGGQVGAGYQSNGDLWYGTLTGATRIGDEADILGSFAYRRSNDFEDGDGETIPFSGDDILTGLIKGTWRPAEFHEFGLSLLTFDDDHLIPSAANTADTDLIVDRDTRQRTATLSYDYDNPADRLFGVNSILYINDVDLHEVLTTTGRVDDTELTTYGLDVANTSRFDFGQSVENELTYGVEYYHDSQEGRRNGAPRPQYPEAEQDVVGLYIQDEITLAEIVTVTPGLRFDRFDRSATGGEDDTDSHVSPKLSVAVAPWEGVSIYASYAEAFRAPSLTELYVGGEHFPGNVFVPNPNLRPEISENKEIGVAIDRDGVFLDDDRLTGRAAYFWNDVDDFIERSVNFFGGTTTNANVLEARIEGFELELGYETPLVFGSLGYSRLRGEDKVEDDPLASIPADKVSLTIGGRIPSADLELGWRMIAAASQDRVPAGEEETPGYAVHDLFVTWRPDDPRFDGARVDFGIENIFDKDYRNHLSVLDSPGRTFKVAVSYRF